MCVVPLGNGQQPFALLHCLDRSDAVAHAFKSCDLKLNKRGGSGRSNEGEYVNEMMRMLEGERERTEAGEFRSGRGK